MVIADSTTDSACNAKKGKLIQKNNSTVIKLMKKNYLEHPQVNSETKPPFYFSDHESFLPRMGKIYKNPEPHLPVSCQKKQPYNT
jgi:hypothetical protein